MVERQGFEPWEGYKPSLVFKTSAFGHSATSPVFKYIMYKCHPSHIGLLQVASGILPYAPSGFASRSPICSRQISRPLCHLSRTANNTDFN